jgi:membrane protein YqaA with SNARE-associated domain
VIDGLLATLGLYGATLAVAFLAGMFPLLSIEAFLIGVTLTLHVPIAVMVALIGIAALGHQFAKTVTYFAGAGAFELPRGKMRARLEAMKQRIVRWNRRPRLVMLVAATVGLPPLYLLGFLAQPVLKIPFPTFTAISLAGRIGRYATLVAVARLF